MARLKVKQISDFSSAVDAAISTATLDESLSIGALEAADSVQDLSIDALGAVDSVQDLSIDALQTETTANTNSLSVILEDANMDLNQFVEVVNLVASVDSVNDLALSQFTTAANLSIDALEAVDSVQDLSINALEAVDSIADLSIDSIETAVTALEDDSEYIKQYGSFQDATNFRVATDIGSDTRDDVSVFINGHQIGHKEGDAGTGWTYSSQTFTFSGIGYDLEADDVFYVIAHKP